MSQLIRYVKRLGAFSVYISQSIYWHYEFSAQLDAIMLYATGTYLQVHQCAIPR